jgi:hypothetical protein
MIEVDSYISRSNKVAWQIIEVQPQDDQALIVTPATSTLHILNGTGTYIWKLLENRIKITDIVNKICNEFEIKEEQAETDIRSFIEELSGKGVVIIEDVQSQDDQSA